MKTKRNNRRNKNRTRRGGAEQGQEVVGEELVIDLKKFHIDDYNIYMDGNVATNDLMGKDKNGNMIWIPQKSVLKDCKAKVKGTHSEPTTCKVEIEYPGESKQTVSTVNKPVTIKIFPNLKEIGKGGRGLSSSCATKKGELPWNYMSHKENTWDMLKKMRSALSTLNEVNNCVGLIPSTEYKVKHFQHGRDPEKLNGIWLNAMNANYDITTENVNFAVQSNISVKDKAETQRTKMLNLLREKENAVIVGSHNQFRKGLFGIDEKIMNCACIHIKIDPLLRNVNADLIYDGEPEITNNVPCPKDEGYLVNNRTNIKYMCKKAISESGYLIEFSEKGVSLSAKETIESKWNEAFNLLKATDDFKPSLYELRNLFIFRHGETLHNLSDKKCKLKFIDNPLTQAGIGQAKRAGNEFNKYLSDKGLVIGTDNTTFVASPLTRTVDTLINILSKLLNFNFLKNVCDNRKMFNETRLQELLGHNEKDDGCLTKANEDPGAEYDNMLEKLNGNISDSFKNLIILAKAMNNESIKNVDSNVQEEVKLLIKQFPNNIYAALLYHAANKLKAEHVKFLLGFKMIKNQVNEKNNDTGETPLIKVCKRNEGTPNSIDVDNKLIMVKELVAAGANPSMTDKKGLTASDWATKTSMEVDEDAVEKYFIENSHTNDASGNMGGAVASVPGKMSEIVKDRLQTYRGDGSRNGRKTRKRKHKRKTRRKKNKKRKSRRRSIKRQ